MINSWCNWILKFSISSISTVLYSESVLRRVKYVVLNKKDVSLLYMSFSNILVKVGNNDIGLKFAILFVSPDLKIGIILPISQKSGKLRNIKL